MNHFCFFGKYISVGSRRQPWSCRPEQRKKYIVVICLEFLSRIAIRTARSVGTYPWGLWHCAARIIHHVHGRNQTADAAEWRRLRWVHWFVYNTWRHNWAKISCRTVAHVWTCNIVTSPLTLAHDQEGVLPSFLYGRCRSRFQNLVRYEELSP